MIAPILKDEKARLSELLALKVLDTPVEEEFEALAASARDLLDVPIVLISLVDQDRQWFKAKIGVDVCETSREIGFCPHAILQAEPMIVEDTLLDERFRENELVTGPLKVRFYAGAQLRINGQPVGTLCCIDTRPRSFSTQQINGLKGLARQAVSLLKSRLIKEKLTESEKRFSAFLDHAPVVAYLKDKEGRLRYVNSRFKEMFGVDPDYALGKTTDAWLPKVAYDRTMQSDRYVLETDEAAEVEQLITFANGQSKIYRSLKFPFGEGEDKMLGGVVLDVTASRAIEATVRQQADELKRHNQQLSSKSSELADALSMANQLEAVSRSAAARFEHLFSGLPIACYTYDESGIVQEWNASSERLFGLAPHQAILQPVVGTAVGKKNKAVFSQLAKATFKGKMTADFEQEETCANGQTRWLLTSHIPLWNNLGQVVGGLCANVDITESKLATNLLKEAQASLIQAQTIASIGSWEMNTLTGEINCSDELLRILDFPKGKSITMTDVVGRTHAEDREVVAETIKQSMRESTGCEINHRLVLPDGRERHLHVLVQTLPGKNKLAGTVQDITERKLMEEALLKSEQKFRSALHSLHEGLVIQAEDGKIMLANDRAGEILGLTAAELMGLESVDPRWQAICEDGAPYPGQDHPAMVALRDGVEQHNCVMGVRKPSGALSWISVNAVPLFMEEQTVPYAAVVTFTDISERKAFVNQIEEQLAQLESQKKLLEFANIKLQSLASTDGLTGLSNHRTFKEQLHSQFAIAERNNSPLSLILLDVDKFKSFNDDFGHQAGDAVLKGLATVLIEVSRNTEHVARYGGEEFAIILPGATAEAAIKAAERFRNSVEGAEWPNRSVTASFGVTSFSAGMDPDEMVRTADEALYMSKHAGRNRVTHYNSEEALKKAS